MSSAIWGLRARSCSSSGKLWVTDGTRTGTSLLHDFSPLARFGTVASTRLGTRRIFAVNPPDRSLELWASDGTAAGTERLAVLTSVVDSVVAPSFAVLGGHVMFAVARRDGQLELWQTDGHVDGTSLVRGLGNFDLSKTPILLSSSERAYLFVAETFELSRLWTSDGTASGTRTLATFPGAGVDFVGIVLGHRLYFAEGLRLGTLWTSDGTASGTQKIPDLRPSGGPFQKIPSGVLLPVRRTGVPDFQNEVWLFQEDGSRRAVASPLDAYSTIAAFDGAGFFFEFHPSEDNSPSRLYFTDGSPAGTRVVGTFPRGTSLLSRGLDATGSALVAVTAPGTRDPVLQRFENRPRTPDLWLDLERFRLDSSSAPRFAVSRPNRLYFTANDDQGRKGWILDPGGPVRPSFPASTTQAATATVDGLLRWTFDEERGQLLTWADETSTLVAEIFATFPPPPLSPVGTDFWFPSTEGLLRYDSGTRTVERLVELEGGSVEQTSAVVPLGGAHYFFQLRLPLTHRLWRTDGTQAGTVPIIDFQGENSRLLSTGQRLFFVRNSSRELWTSDGTSDGTRSLPLPTGLQISGRLVTVAGRVFFTPYNSTLGDEELWTSDGTAEGTVRLLGNLGDLCCRQEAPELVPLGNGVVFAAAPDNAGAEPWWSDGTAAGTRRIADLWPGLGSSSPREFTALGGRVFFRASDPEHGAELWVTDGTFEGTSRLTDLNPGVRGSNPTAFAALGDRLFFGADDGEIGAEPWLLPLDAVGERPIPPLPSATWLTSNAVPGFRFQVRFAGGILGRRETDCIGETLCVSGAVAGRPEVFLRVVGPRPNGFLWPTLVKFTTSEVEIWVEQEDTGQLRYYTLAAARPGIDELPARFDRLGFQPTASFTAAAARGESDPPPPAGSWFESTAVPGFRFKVRIANGSPNEPTVRQEPDCIAETVCVSGAIPGRSEVFARVVGPRPNGFLWPIVARFTGSRVEVWIEQKTTGEVQYYDLPAVSPASDALTGLFDREGFAP
ncbi:MAG: hypothetical protein SF066_16905 [Thermoanaerobaculia bacterium]|nr:hypothetical protein [Thermoanaerobaculia bacterium]